jgi:ribosome-binding factor A
MEKSTKRIRQVADLIQRDLAMILQREVSDPRLAEISITGVVVSPDLGTAKVYYTVYDKEQLAEVKAGLEKASGYLRHLLAEATTLRYTPQLRFAYDESILYGEKLSALINTANEEPKDSPAKD